MFTFYLVYRVSLKVIKTIKEITNWEFLQPVILVPTMGALHDGHRKLIREGNAIKGNKGTLVVSIYLNPIQFNDPKDLDKYPRTLDTDYETCEEEGVDLIFAPSDVEMYPNPYSIGVSENNISQELCGSKRPGHFDGVCTVVTKLFNLIKPKIAIFGKKDYQQLSIIRQLIIDLNYPIEIIAIETQRDKNGLAMSSRNEQLNEIEKEKASVIYKALEAMVNSGESQSKHLIKLGKSIIEKESQIIKIDYIEVVDRSNLKKLKVIDRPALAAIAVFIGKTRLIDNIEIDLE
ncbi:MAG: pantoate--beta-alanine ligase [Rickettsiales bacterium]|nr:pantoate--beta-alanine ligase [Rickettsiales bacterium]|tara:strand:+ start:17151 stop:18020 length:870 start_codon:yes stop_codon:yes gene_type:complete